MFLIPILLIHINNIFLDQTFFYKLILVSIISGIFFNIFTGKLVDISNFIALKIGIITNIIFYLLLLSNNNIIYYIAFIFEGISFSFLVIRRPSYQYQYLKENYKNLTFKLYESNIKMYSFILLILINIISPILFNQYYLIPFILNIILLLIILIFLPKLKKLNKEKKRKEKNLLFLKNIFKNDKYKYKLKNLKYLLFSEALFSALIVYYIFIVQNHLSFNSMKLEYIGILFSLTFIMRFLGNYILKFINININKIFYLIILIFLGTFLIGYLNNIYFISIIFLFINIITSMIETLLISLTLEKSDRNFHGRIRSISEIINNIFLLIIFSLIIFLPQIFKYTDYVIYLFAICFFISSIFIKIYQIKSKK